MELKTLWTAFYMPFIHFVPKLLAGLVVLLLFWVASWILCALINRIKKRFPERVAVFDLFKSTTKVTVLLIGVVSALGTMGMNVTALVASLGLTGFALGYALKDSISNMIAGVLIILYRPFKVNDQISIGGNEGKVTFISLRYIQLDEGNDKVYLIPNSTAFSQAITVFKT